MPSLAFAAATGFLLMLGLSVLFPVLPYYTRWLSLSEIEAGALMSIYAGIAVIVSPLWGRFSERFGRKPAIVIGLTGFGVGFTLFGLGRTFAELLGARVLQGLFAAAAMPALFAYVADVTPPERRSAAMGVLGAAIGLGVISGPVVGGFLAPLGLRLPFFAAGGIGFLAAALAVLFLPESLHAGRRQQAREQTGTPTAARERWRRLAPFLVYAFLIATARMGFEGTVGFMVDDRFGRGPRAVGILLGVVGLIGVVVQGGAIRLLTRRFRDVSLMLVGTGLIAGGLYGVAIALTWIGLLAAGAVLAVGYALATPTFTAQLSRVGAAHQGEAQGLNHGAQSLGRVAGPIAFTAIYQHYGSKACYLAAAAVTVAAGVLAVVWLVAVIRRYDPQQAVGANSRRSCLGWCCR